MHQEIKDPRDLSTQKKTHQNATCENMLKQTDICLFGNTGRSIHYLKQARD